MNAQLDISTLSIVDTATLRAELSRGLKLTAEYLTYLAAIWNELESRGEDLADLCEGIGVYVWKIAQKTLLPEAVEEFADRPNTLRKVAKLSIQEQHAAVEAGTVATETRKPRLHKGRMVSSDDKPGIETLVKMAAVGSSHDVAEICARIVRASSNPPDTAWRLAMELEQIANPKKKQRAM